MTTAEEYLRNIPAAHRSATNTIVARLSLWAKDLASELQPVVFLPGQKDHPVFDDAARVFDEAVEQLLLADAPRPNEVPLLFVGYHAMNRFTRKRQTLGFLVTDQRIVIQDKFAGVFGRELPNYRMLPVTSVDPVASSHALISSVGSAFDWSDMVKLIGADSAEGHSPEFRLTQLLADAVTSVVQLSQVLGLAIAGEPDEEETENATAAELVPRLAELGIRSDVLLADDPRLAKMLKKFGPKIGLGDGETIAFASLDKTFAGVYGIVVTDTAVRSCDLMEEPVVSLRSAIDPASVKLDDKATAIITEPGVAHVLVSHLSADVKNGIVTALRELIAGDIKP
ncbi:hypothetical protein I6E52_12100 [Salinibacterium sp. NG253]|uniref:hypothetical protein n=1 Tax=Salinibacterium sp. NG253 TaxID=2792039 RepID=UPI0018CD9AD7|nr:hypothetical protein [Salinibacterium sp. NG253]MBH0117582.1 hypothetical protein [Salinibacterium sp. NG253]